MSRILSTPQKIDSNVTINPPKEILIQYEINQGWYIKIDGKYIWDETHEDETTMRSPKYFKDAGEPLQWLINRHLVVTKAYSELEKAVKKVNSKSKK